MNKSLACFLCAALTFIIPHSAFAEESKSLQAMELSVSRIGDIEMSCGSLSQEALTMREIINTTQDIKDKSTLQSHGINAAGAVGSFVIGTVTGGIGLAAAGFLLGHNVDEQADTADSVQDVAEQRRSLMMGIYNAKGCFGPIEHAMQNPQELDLMSLAAVSPASGEEEKERAPHYNN